MIPNLMNAAGLDTSDEYTQGISAGPQSSGTGAGPSTEEIQHGLPNDGRLLQLAQEAESQAITFFNSGVRSNWARSYKAFRNQHMEGSKYSSPEYRGRSKYFRPKTRIAVQKSMASVAQSLMGTADVVAVTAQNESDDAQVASASLKQELLNYRLQRQSRRNGIRWFMTAMGAYQTAKITGICISKQSWIYREDSPVAGEAPDGSRAILEDRPGITLIAPENCLFDANCDWTNPAQSSQYLIVRNPMSVDEAMALIEQSIAAGNNVFLNVSRERVQSCARSSAPNDTVAARSAREGGKDPIMQASGAFSRVWVNEVFMRVGNLDVVYWTLDNKILLSKPMPVRKAYPEYSGERPIVIGYGALEAFRSNPMSPVESWQQMQQETNDQANLRLDHMKQVVAPKAKVKRGQQVDLTQVQRAGPHGLVMVNEHDDVEWWQPPDLPQSAFVENNYLTADFDSLAGVFDAGSVNNNRQMNETVGGMKLLAASTNPQASFDLEVWIETWAAPVIWQIMKLEEMYENDATVLAICGQKAKLWERFGVDQITDELLMRETNVNIKLGVGVNNLPQERLQAFAQAWGVASQTLAPFIQGGLITPPRPKVAEIIETLFSAAGFKDGGNRFFDGLEESGNQPPPPQNQLQMAEQQNKAASVQVQAQKVQLDHQAKMAQLEQQKQDSYARLEAEHAKAMAEIGKALIENHHDAARQGRDHAHDDFMRQREAAQGFVRDQLAPQAAPMQGGQQGQQAAMPQQGAAPQQAQATAPAVKRSPADERHAAFMDAIKNMGRPMRVQRGEDGSIVGVE